MDLSHMIPAGELKNSNFKKIFFYRICGTGMGACACLAKEAGYEVAGADLTFSPPMSTYLESSGIELSQLEDISTEKLQEYDLIIVGNSVPRKSDYARLIESSGVPFTSFPSFLGELILSKKNVIGLAGTHGKTTTTYFLTQMLENLQQNPGYFIGGIMNDRPPSKLGEDFFTIESDEYDSAYFQKISKFRLYELNHMILTSLEFDHADIFSDIEDIKDEFRSILNDFGGQLVVNDAYPAIKELSEEYPKLPWTFYGLDSERGPRNIEVNQSGSNFEIELDHQYYQAQTNIIGTHNILNISGCMIMLNNLGFKAMDILESIKSFDLVKRRQEERGHYRGALVIDDFAHHPKAITLTLQALKQKYPGKKVLTVFEPISATARSSLFQNEFAESLRESDEVIMAMNSLKTTVEGTENLSGEKIVTFLQENGVPAVDVNTLSDLQTQIDNKIDEKTLLVILSNRTCLGLWESDFVKNLV